MQSSSQTAALKRRKVDIPLPLERRGWFSTVWFSAGAALLLTGAFAVVSVELARTDPATWQLAAPENGYLWAVTQYKDAFMRLRVELTFASSKTTGSLYPEDIKASARTLGEAAKALKPADGGTASAQLPAYREAVEKIDAFQAKVAAVMGKRELTRDDAMLTLIDLESMDSTLTRMAANVADSEKRQREISQEGLRRRNSLIWSVMAGTWVLVVGWLLSIGVYARRQRAADIARRRALDAERQAVHDKDEAVQAKSRFLTSISHELRSALQRMGSALEMLEKAESPQAKKTLIARIQRAAAALATQLRDLVTVAVGDAGKLEMSPSAFEACELVEELAVEFQDAAAEKGLKVKVRTPAEPIYVVADHTRIAQILTNLVSNAVKYTNAGEITVTLAPFDPIAERLVISVRDTGPGIPRQFMDTIFRQYERVGGVDRKSESAGIGLAVVQTLVKALAGQVQVNSAEGTGTEFVVEIPVKSQLDDLPLPPTGSSVRLLIVDDQVELLEGLADVARSVGASVETARSAAHAANWMAMRTFDLVLVDLDMPHKTGQELASETRRGSSINRNTRIIAMSAADRRSVGAVWPFDGFQAKPILSETFKQLLAETRAAALSRAA